MKLKVMVVGRTTSAWIREGEEMYCGRISRYVPFEYDALPDIRATRSLTPEKQKEQEGQMMLSTLKPGETVVLLDEKGKEMTSREFSEFLQKRMAAGATKGLTFIIGGPYGFSPAAYERSDYKISLSRMTFTHEMARLLLIEQIYRGLSILRGDPYHHD